MSYPGHQKLRKATTGKMCSMDSQIYSREVELVPLNVVEDSAAVPLADRL